MCLFATKQPDWGLRVQMPADPSAEPLLHPHSQQVHAHLRTFAPDGQVERTSYDDFYLDVTASCSGSGGGNGGGSSGGSGGGGGAGSGSLGTAEPQAQPPAGLLVLPGEAAAPPAAAAAAAQQVWEALPADLQRGVQLAVVLRAAAEQHLGLTLSCGVARNKLLARLASPAAKPDGLAVVPDSAAVPFIRKVPLQKVPQLR